MRRLKCILLAIVILLSAITVISSAEGFSSDDIDISDLIFDDNVEEISLKMPAFSDMQLIAQNENVKFYFYPSGLDVYLVTNTGKVWSNVLIDEYYHQETPSAQISSQIMTVNACDKSGESKEYVLYDGSNTDIKAEYSINNDELELKVTIKEIELSFKVLFGIEDDGFYYYIPDKDIKEKSGKIISISLLQNFGASRNDEKGYIFYPDGSGAIMKFAKAENTGNALNQFPVYGGNDITYAQLERNLDDNIYGALLPVYGIAQTKDGFVTVIDNGAADAKINVAMPGYQISDVYRAFVTYSYRNFSTIEFNKTTLLSLVDERTKVDRKCYYYFLSGNENDYSGMANRYRKHLENNGTLKQKNQSKNIQLSINMLCAVQKNGIFSKTLQKMTTFNQAQQIMEWLFKNNIKQLDVHLSGWADGGWDALPTKIKAEGKLGGKGGLKKLREYCAKEGVDLSLDVDSIFANSETGSFNARNDAVRNYFGDFFIDKTKTKYILNSVRVLENAYSDFKKDYSETGINLLTVGKLAFPDYNSKNVCTTQEIIESYISVMKNANKDKIRISATTGNAYILPYVNMIYSLPQSDSGHTCTTKSVPFYQMVIHGYIPYTGTTGNTHYDFQKCILEWVETGSIPNFLLTFDDTNKLLETNYNSVFSSEFDVWKDKIAKTYNKFNIDFSSLQNETISSHESFDNGISRLIYSNGDTVYVNYNDVSCIIDGHTVEGKDYLIIRGE